MTETLGERIHRLRKEKHLSMDEVAKQMGYNTRSTICRLEKGEIDLQQQKLKKMAEILGVSPAYLVMREELDEPNTLTLNVKGIDSINISLNETQTIDVLKMMIDYNDANSIDGQLKDLLSLLEKSSNEDIDTSTGEAVFVRK